MKRSDRFKPSEDSIETLLGRYDFAVSVEVTNHINGTNGKSNGRSNGRSRGNYPKKASQAIRAKGFLEGNKNGHDLEIMTALAYRDCCIDDEQNGIDYHIHLNQEEIESSLPELIKIVEKYSSLSETTSTLLSDILYVNEKFPGEYPLKNFFFGNKEDKKKCEKRIMGLEGNVIMELSPNQYYGRLAMIKASILEFYVPYSIILGMDDSSDVEFLNSTSFIYYEEFHNKEKNEIWMQKRMGESDIFFFCREEEFYQAIGDNPYLTLEEFEH